MLYFCLFEWNIKIKNLNYMFIIKNVLAGTVFLVIQLKNNSATVK